MTWLPCPCCDCFLCTIHGKHVHDCPCPPVEEWPGSPYEETEDDGNWYDDPEIIPDQRM